MTDLITAAFPKDFLWGAATASHQVEGNNVNNHYRRTFSAERGPDRVTSTSIFGWAE